MSLKEVLLEWKEMELPGLIKREVKTEMNSHIISIIGPRRAGKTYYMYQLIKELEKREGYTRDNIAYVDFSDPRARVDISMFLKVVNSLFRKPIFLFLDEIQELKGWQDFLRVLHNLRRYKIIISGSSSKLLSREIATQLRGRSIDKIIFPFSFKEFLKCKGIEIKGEISEMKKGDVLRELNTYLEYGGYPEIVLEKSIYKKKDMVRTYFNTIFYRDLVDRFKIRNTYLMEFMLKYCISNASSYLSLSKLHKVIHNYLKVSKKTIAIYWKNITEALFIFPIMRFSFKFGERSLFPLKVYLVDNVYFLLEPRFSKDIGKRMENCTALNLIKKVLENKIDSVFYWKDYQSKEVDFVVKEGLKVGQLIQVTYASNRDEIEKREIKSLLKASELLKCKDLLCITWDYEGVETIGRKKIRFLPLWKWLLDFK